MLSPLFKKRQIRLLVSVLLLIMLAGCGSSFSPTRPGDDAIKYMHVKVIVKDIHGQLLDGVWVELKYDGKVEFSGYTAAGEIEFNDIDVTGKPDDWYVYVSKDGAEKETNIPSAGGWRSEVTLHLPLGI